MRGVLALLFCVAMTAHVLRSAVVAAPGESWLDLAQRLWPDHPRVLTASIMRDVGTAAGRGQNLPPATLKQTRMLADRNALAAEPFLVLGAQAYQAGDLGRAEKLLVEARRRNPRSAAGRYLLGSLYLETGRLGPGLKESAAIARLLPGSAAQLAPALAQYVSAPGGAEQVYHLLKAHSDLAPPLLNELAGNPRNADLLVSLSSTVPAGPFSHRWQQRLIGGLIGQQDYAKAWSVWARLNGQDERSRPPVYDAGFQDASSAPPFNWELSRNGGLVERRNGSLHVLYFGRDDVTLARQVLLLAPGTYEIGMDVAGDLSGSQDLRWEIACLPGAAKILTSALRGNSNAKLRASFTVPSAGCKAQDLHLQAAPGDFPATSDFSISNLALKRAERT